MIDRFMLVIFLIAGLGTAAAEDQNRLPSDIDNKKVVIAVDFVAYSAKTKSSELLGSVLVLGSGALWIRSSEQGEWREEGHAAKGVLESCRTLVKDPKNLKPFVLKDDRRRFRLNMDNYHVRFPEAVRALYRVLIAEAE